MSRKKNLVTVSSKRPVLRLAKPKTTQLHNAITSVTDSLHQPLRELEQSQNAVIEMMFKFNQQLVALGIDKLYIWVGVNNPTNDIPYHNLSHISYMTWLTFRFLTYTPNTVSDYELKHALVAAMFHDFNHSGGHESDAVNIERAIDGYHVALAELNIVGLDDALVERLISVTEYPFIREPVNIMEKSLRDADALYPACTQDPEVILTGLRLESEIKLGRSITRAEMIVFQETWLKNLVLYTTIGKRTHSINSHNYLKEMKQAVDV